MVEAPGIVLYSINFGQSYKEQYVFLCPHSLLEFWYLERICGDLALDIVVYIFFLPLKPSLSFPPKNMSNELVGLEVFFLSLFFPSPYTLYPTNFPPTHLIFSQWFDWSYLVFLILSLTFGILHHILSFLSKMFLFLYRVDNFYSCFN